MEFGPYSVSSLRPSQIRSWMTRLGEEGLKDSYIYALHARLAQIMSDAVHDGLLAKSPCSRRTSPHMAQQRVYVATTGQVWELYDLFPERIRLAVLLGAFVGLRLGADIKTVQARLRHASAETTLDTYGHIWPDRDEFTRAAVDAVITARTEQGRNSGDTIRQRPRSRPG